MDSKNINYLNGETPLFPSNSNNKVTDTLIKNIRIDHFSFNVNKENFEKFKRHFTALNVDCHNKDYHYLHSIYTKDPDNHTVELTTIVVNEKNFYEQ